MVLGEKNIFNALPIICGRRTWMRDLDPRDDHSNSASWQAYFGDRLFHVSFR